MFYKVDIEKSSYLELIIEADTEAEALEAAEDAMYFDEYDEKIEDCGWEYTVEDITKKVGDSQVENIRRMDLYVNAKEQS